MTKDELLGFEISDIKRMADDLGLESKADATKDELAQLVANSFGAAPDTPASLEDLDAAAPASAPSTGEMAMALDAILTPEPLTEIPEATAPPADELPPLVPAGHTAQQTVDPQPEDSVGNGWPSVEEFKAAMKPFLARGLQIIVLNKNYFHIRNGNKENSGNMGQPLKTIVQQAGLLFQKTRVPSEE